MKCPACGSDLERTVSGTWLTCPRGDSKLYPAPSRRSVKDRYDSEQRALVEQWSKGLPLLHPHPKWNRKKRMWVGYIRGHGDGPWRIRKRVPAFTAPPDDARHVVRTNYGYWFLVEPWDMAPGDQFKAMVKSMVDAGHRVDLTGLLAIAPSPSPTAPPEGTPAAQEPDAAPASAP